MRSCVRAFVRGKKVDYRLPIADLHASMRPLFKSSRCGLSGSTSGYPAGRRPLLSADLNTAGWGSEHPSQVRPIRFSRDRRPGEISKVSGMVGLGAPALIQPVDLTPEANWTICSRNGRSPGGFISLEIRRFIALAASNRRVGRERHRVVDHTHNEALDRSKTWSTTVSEALSPIVINAYQPSRREGPLTSLHAHSESARRTAGIGELRRRRGSVGTSTVSRM
jgi:hypothetical protein